LSWRLGRVIQYHFVISLSLYLHRVLLTSSGTSSMTFLLNLLIR
jgi:hypothetical protein